MDNTFDLNDLINFDEEFIKSKNIEYNILINKAYGARFIDNNNNEYIDYTSNFDCNPLGYNNEAINQSIKSNLNNLLSTTPLFKQNIIGLLSKKLIDLSGLGYVFYSNSSFEALSTTLNIIKAYSKYNSKSQNQIMLIGVNNSNIDTYEIGNFSTSFDSLRLINSNKADTSTLKNIFSKKNAGTIINPYRVVNGTYIVDTDLIETAKDLTKRNESILIFDLSSVSIGRTGSILPITNINPDAIIMSKGLNPTGELGLVIISQELNNIIEKNYSHPFRCSTLACYTANTYLDFVNNTQFFDEINKKSQQLGNLLNNLHESFLNIVDIQIKGLLVYIEMDFDLNILLETIIKDNKAILALENSYTIKLTPPLNIDDEDIKNLYTMLEDNLNKFKVQDRLKPIL